jgi:hypothetical protein
MSGNAMPGTEFHQGQIGKDVVVGVMQGDFHASPKRHKATPKVA